jgi:hypothetical protein
MEIEDAALPTVEIPATILAVSDVTRILDALAHDDPAASEELLPLLLLLILPGVAQAQSYTNNYGIWTYTTTNHTITITNYSGPGGAVTIPERIPDTTNGLPVTSIGGGSFLLGGWGAFYGCISLTSVTIPDSVTSIGPNAFWNCTSLGSLTIPNSVTNIGVGAFEWCSGLTSVTIGTNVVNIADYAFFDCANLTSVTIPASVTNIGDYAFWDCTSLTSVTIGTNVSSIGQYAFWVCTSLTSLTIPDSVTSIGGCAFWDCTCLTRVYFQGNAPRFGTNVFVVGFYTSVAGPGIDARRAAAAIEQIEQGSTPNSDTNVFVGFRPSGVVWQGPVGLDPATIYYLPATTGWSTHLNVPWTDNCLGTDNYGDTGFAWLPTLLWLPQVQTSDGSFGVRGNQFGFNINWASGMTVVVEASTSLVNLAWSPISTNTLTSGSAYFSDPESSQYPTRFYRLRWP